MGAVATGVPAIGAATDTAGARESRQTRLRAAPRLGIIEPCLPSPAKAPPSGPGSDCRPLRLLASSGKPGVLATYGLNVPTLYRRAGAFIDKILKGANSADLPVEQPTKFELLINLKTAKAIGVTVPPTIHPR
jgi:hypothetical protein